MRHGRFRRTMGLLVINPDSSRRYKAEAIRRARRANWAQGAEAYNAGVTVGVDITEFQIEVERLGLAGRDWVELRKSDELRKWAKRFCSRRYVPEELILSWHLNVNGSVWNICNRFEDRS